MSGRQTQSQLLRAAVAAICPDIQVEVKLQARARLSDEALWHELSCCLLSSQVPYSLAQATADEISRVGVLKASPHRTREEVQDRIQQILNGRFRIGSAWRRYRFPLSRSEQLAHTWEVVTAQAGSLSGVLQKFEDVNDARCWFVVNAPGIGPKQASMFLRNIGISYDLAILDRHVLKYMDALGMQRTKSHRISDMPTYRAMEAVLREHAAEMGYPVGVLDWAIWIVMRVTIGDGRLEQ